MSVPHVLRLARLAQCSSITPHALPAASCAFSPRMTSSRSRNESDTEVDHTHAPTNKLRRQRPLLHLSSAPGEKYNGKEIGSPYPIFPHEVSPIRLVQDPSIPLPPWYKCDSAANVDTNDCRHDVMNHNDPTDARRVGLLAKEALKYALHLLRPGITTDSLDASVHDFVIDRGAYPSFLLCQGYPKSICTSINEVIHCGLPDGREIEAGDVISVAVRCYRDGLHAEVCETVVVEPEVEGAEDDPSYERDQTWESRQKRSKRLVRAVKEAMNRGIERCNPGSSITAIGRSIQSVAESYDYRIVKEDRIGNKLQCLPGVKYAKGNDEDKAPLLEPGMMLYIAPIFVEGHSANALWSNAYTACTVDGGIAAQYGHTVLVTGNGATILTS